VPLSEGLDIQNFQEGGQVKEVASSERRYKGGGGGVGGTGPTSPEGDGGKERRPRGADMSGKEGARGAKIRLSRDTSGTQEIVGEPRVALRLGERKKEKLCVGKRHRSPDEAGGRESTK